MKCIFYSFKKCFKSRISFLLDQKLWIHLIFVPFELNDIFLPDINYN